MFSLDISPLFQKLLLVSCVVYCLSALCPSAAFAGTWRVSPIKLYFDAKTRNDVITIVNDGEQPLSLAITAMEWSQDQNGQDIYQPATDLIYFPKQLTVEPQKERVIRAGIKVPAANKEKTYRLFIKELPNRQQAEPNTVAIAIQFGVPVFVKPSVEDIKGAVTETVVTDGNFSAKIVNQGNSHLRINSIVLNGTSVSGALLYDQELSGWYILGGSSRTFTTTIPREICLQLSVLDIQVNTDRNTFNGRVDVDQISCSVP